MTFEAFVTRLPTDTPRDLALRHFQDVHPDASLHEYEHAIGIVSEAMLWRRRAQQRYSARNTMPRQNIHVEYERRRDGD